MLPVASNSVLFGGALLNLTPAHSQGLRRMSPGPLRNGFYRIDVTR